MLTVYSERHRRQNGRAEFNDGRLVPCHENPSRAEVVLERVRAAGLGPIVEPVGFGGGPLARVHDSGYLSFLRTAHAEWVEEHGAGCDALPLNWLAPGMHRRVVPGHIDGRLGFYSFDAGTPITEGTWEAATSGADCALTAARAVAEGASAAFALVRPPGHHAGRAFLGGYCFLNNAAIAAQWLRDQGAARVAILDVDYHHGNGTQEIFWTRGDVLFVSLHADPFHEFPYFSGYACETGEGEGDGTTLNLPLPFGTGWDDYADALAAARRRIAAFAPDALVVSLGADAYEGDPISRFRLTSDDYRRLGAAIAAIGAPAVFTLEGGYAVAELGVNVVNTLSGFAESRP
jgi:acetoin utilization deacetylase AcuC-like enzyme